MDKESKPITNAEQKVIDACREIQDSGWGTVEVIIRDGKLTRVKAEKEVKLD